MTVRMEYGRGGRRPDPPPCVVEFKCPSCKHWWAPEILVVGKGYCPWCLEYIDLNGAKKEIHGGAAS